MRRGGCEEGERVCVGGVKVGVEGVIEEALWGLWMRCDGSRLVGCGGVRV